MNLLLTLITDYGLWLVFGWVLAEQLGAPLPAYPVLIVTGALAVGGEPPMGALYLTALAACLLADSAWYLAGQRHGRGVLRTLCRISLSPDGCVRQTETLFGRWGAPALIVAKFIPGFASVATAMAGSTRVRWRSFLFFDAIGATLWIGIALALGVLFAPAIDQVLAVLEALGRWGLMLVLAVFGVIVAAKWWNRYRFRRQLQMDRISVDQLAGLMARGEAPLVIDVRSPAAQQEGRIPHALAVGVADEHWPQGLAGAAPDGLVVIYCACPNEASAAVLARKLMARGFTRVRPLEGGIDAWRAAGHPVEG